MVQSRGQEFDTAAYLAHAGMGRKIVRLEPKQAFFSQGDPADSTFYLHNGRAKITVVSQTGKEATIAILAKGDFLGEESLTATLRWWDLIASCGTSIPPSVGWLARL
jgi:CRP-like cAMP-binding protein